MTSKHRLAALEQDLRIAEAAYTERLGMALRGCVGGSWGLFGANDAAYTSHFGRASPCSERAGELLELGAKISKMRSQAGFAEVFHLHERFLEYRKRVATNNAPGEPKLAQEFLDEIGGSK